MVGKVIRNLGFYFGLYFLSIELDKWVTISNFENIDIIPAAIGINASFLI